MPGACAAGACPVFAPARYFSTSSLVTRPPSPLPGPAELYRVVSRDAPRGGGGLHVGGGRRGGWRLGAGGWRHGGWRLAAGGWSLDRPRSREPGAWSRFLDDGQQLTDLHVLALLPIDPRQHARLIGADLEIDLVGLELHHRLARRDRIANLLQPPRDAGFDDGLTELGDEDVRHILDSCGSECRVPGAGLGSRGSGCVPGSRFVWFRVRVPGSGFGVPSRNAELGTRHQ